MKNYISYNLTKTIPGPRIKIGSPEEGFEIIRRWVQEFTIGKFTKFELQLLIPVKKYPKLEFLDDMFTRQPLTAKFNDDHFCEWTFVYKALPKLFKLIKENLSFFELYNYQIIVNTDFVLLDEQKNVVKGQNLFDSPERWSFMNEYSGFMIFINSYEVKIEPHFMFPFDNDGDEFKKFYNFFKANLPFKLDDKNLYITLEAPKSKYGEVTKKLRK